MALATLLAFLPALAAQEGSGDVLRGVVLLKGELPERRSYPAPTEREKAAFPEGIFTDPVDVDRERHVRSALVYVKAGLEKKAFVPPREPRILEIENFQLKPRMIGIMAGQELLVTNRDGILHAIHAHPSAPGNKEFNAGLPARDMSFKATFDAPEVALPIRTECLHDWETAWVAVLAHPYYAVTDSEGRYEIKGLPPGRYTLEAWQENCVPAARELQVKSGATVAVDWTLEARVRTHLFISGRVQGVGFRASTEAEARRLGGLSGWVKNLPDGRVEAVVEGPREKVEALAAWCRKGPPSAEVTGVERQAEPPRGLWGSFQAQF